MAPEILSHREGVRVRAAAVARRTTLPATPTPSRSPVTHAGSQGMSRLCDASQLAVTHQEGGLGSCHHLRRTPPGATLPSASSDGAAQRTEPARTAAPNPPGQGSPRQRHPSSAPGLRCGHWQMITKNRREPPVGPQSLCGSLSPPFSLCRPLLQTAGPESRGCPLLPGHQG